MFMDDDLKLVYINPIGENSNGKYEYELFFSKTPELVWGENWEMPCASICGDMKPDESTYSNVKRIISDIPFFCVQENTCFSMQDCIDGCVALFFEDISNYSEYPTPYRIVCSFGEDYKNVKEKLNGRGVCIE